MMKKLTKIIIPYCFELKKDCIQRKCLYWKVIRIGKWGKTEVKYDKIDECITSKTTRIFLGTKEERTFLPVEREITTITSFVYNYYGRCSKIPNQKDYFLGQEKVVLPDDCVCENIKHPNRLMGYYDNEVYEYYKTHPQAKGIKDLSEIEIADEEYGELVDKGILSYEKETN